MQQSHPNPNNYQANRYSNSGGGSSGQNAPGSVGELHAGLPLPLPRTESEALPTLQEWNARYIEYVLNFTKGKKTAAARILGINRRTLYRRKKAQANQAPGGTAGGGDESRELHNLQ